MKKSNITFSEFVKEFEGSSYEHNFSRIGKIALYDYLSDLEEETGEEIELDIVALCCDYTEYENLKECFSQYDNIKTIEELKEKTEVIELEDGGLIIRNFVELLEWAGVKEK